MLVVQTARPGRADSPPSRPRTALEGLVVVAVGRPVPEHLAGVAVGAFLSPAAVVSRVRRLLQHLRLGWTVFGVVEVKAAADIAEETRFLL